MSLSAGRAWAVAAHVVVTIQPTEGRYRCADNGVASVVFDLEVDLANVTNRHLVLPTGNVVIWNERYWRADDRSASPPGLVVDGKVVLTSPLRPPQRADFIALPPGGHHAVRVPHYVVVQRSGKLADGMLIPGRYRAQLAIGPGATFAEDVEVLRGLGQDLGTPWPTIEWSQPLMFEIGPFPEQLPGCQAG